MEPLNPNVQSGQSRTNTNDYSQAGHSNIQYNNCTIGRQADDIDKLKAWLSPSDHTVEYETAKHHRTALTGIWLLRHGTYIAWKEGTIDHLWLHGKAGCGKTILCSTVIDDLKAHQSGILLYFYFTFSDTRKQTLENAMFSLAWQLIHIPSAKSALLALMQHTSRPNVYMIQDALHEILSSLDEVTLVLDALDEVSETNSARKHLLHWIEHMCTSTRVRLLMTSRREEDIADHLEPLPQIVIHSHIQHDIQLYVDTQLSKDKRLIKFTPEVKQKIRSSVVDRADGMFRWVFLMLDEMSKLRRSADSVILAALAAFPEGLDATYERILLTLSSEHAPVFTLLQWITYASRPMTLCELAETLTIDTVGDVVDFTQRGNADDILRLLSSLITTVHDDDRVYPKFSADSALHNPTAIRLAHFTVQEYLESSRILATEVAQFHLRPTLTHRQLTQSCITYLRRYTATPPYTRHYFPLLERAVWQWQYHSVRHDQTDVRSEISLLEDIRGRTAWQYNLHCFSGSPNTGFPKTTTWIHGVNHFDYKEWRHVGLSGLLAGNALYHACVMNSLSIVNALLARGHGPNISSGDFTALHGAVMFADVVIVQRLLDAGAEIDALDHDGSTPLQHARLRQHTAMEHLLIDAQERRLKAPLLHNAAQ